MLYNIQILKSRKGREQLSEANLGRLRKMEGRSIGVLPGATHRDEAGRQSRHRNSRQSWCSWGWGSRSHELRSNTKEGCGKSRPKGDQSGRTEDWGGNGFMNT